MRVVSLLTLVGLATLTFGAVACGGAEESSPAAATEDGEGEELRAKLIGASDNGKTVTVTLGQSFTIALTDNGASTGYIWKVTSVDRSLGSPKESTIPGDAGKPGSPGLKKFTWRTKSPFDLVGQHKITLQSVRPWAETTGPAATFDVTVDIVAPAPKTETCGGIVPLKCAGGSFCAYPASAQCGAADQTGTCQQTPQFCPMVVIPVCGCDGKTYNNSCEANRAGVSVASSGECAATAAD